MRVLPNLRLRLKPSRRGEIVVLSIVVSLALELVPTGHGQPRRRRRERTHVDGLDVPRELGEVVGAGLKSRTKDSVREGPPGVHPLVAGLPAEGRPRAVAEDQRGRVKGGSPQTVRIVAPRNVGRGADVERSSLVRAFDLIAGHRNRVDDDRRRHIDRGNAGRRRADIDLDAVVRAEHAQRQACGRRQVVVHEALAARAPRGVVAVESIEQVVLQPANGIPQPVAECPAANRAPGSDVTE